MPVEYDEIGVWPEVKLAIIKKYASAYTSIIDSQRREKTRACAGCISTRMLDPAATFPKQAVNWLRAVP